MSEEEGFRRINERLATIEEQLGQLKAAQFVTEIDNQNDHKFFYFVGFCVVAAIAIAIWKFY